MIQYADTVITGLFYYPVKGCHGIALHRAVLGPTGIRNDRRWLIITEEGEFLTQRRIPRLALIHPRVDNDQLALTAAGVPRLQVEPQHSLLTRTVRVWSSDCETVDLGPTPARWLPDFLGVPARLVTMAPGFIRSVDPRYSLPGDQVGFADGFPLLLTSESSLIDLNGRLETPVPMSRFRPGIVIAGPPPYAEDGWREIRIPARNVSMRVAKPCGRCVVTTTDQEIGVRMGDEPLATLTRYRMRNEPGQAAGAMFGQNLIHEWSGADLAIEVGDQLLALS